ncbi:non-ribosomal peptide synthetase, partial [Mycobacterium gastri]|uniref:non-ribosomal peptide synthetase n=1 Tax=Mycobacterium gastri TaxID=1777 RepID=UPI00111C5248
MLNYGAQPDILGPLAAGQRSMWAVQQLQPEVPYAIAGFLAIDHHVDVEKLTAACESAAARFGTQCARLSLVDGEPVFMVDRSLPQSLRSLRCIDLRAESDPVAAAHSWMNNNCYRPIDLVRDRLTDIALLWITDNLSYFYLRAHHVLFDGYGANNFIRHIAAAYSGSAATAIEVDFSEFALIREADQKYQQSARSDADAEYWQTIVDRPADVADLGGGGRSAGPRHPQMRELVCRHLSENHQLDVARVIATMAIFIAKTTGRQNVSMSLPVSARTTAALKRAAGMVANMVPLRIRVDDGDTIGALTDQVAKALVGALRHQQFRRWPDLIADAAHLDNLDFGPIINILDFATPFRFGSSEPTYNVLTNGPVKDIAVNLYPRLGHGAPRIQFAWNPDRYSADDIARHITRLESLCDRLLVADGSVVVGEVSLLDGGERELVVSGFSGAGVAAPVGVVSQVLAAAVAADPDAVAIIDGARQVSYRQLDESSTRLARVLIEAGVGPERAVGVAMDRCAELVVTWWAVVKAGGVYVPVDAAHPVERIAAVLDTADAVCVLSCAAHSLAGAGARPVIRVDELDLSDRRADPITDAERRSPLSVDNTAYVIFTSGSTGAPKGVAVGHAGLLGMAAAQRELFGVGAQARILMVAAPTFDASVFELLWAAGSAAAMVVAPPQVYAGDALTSLLHDQQVSAAVLTPTVLASLDRTLLDGVDTLVIEGEACPPELVTAWAPGRRMFNAYGPTEATIWATCTTPLSPGQPITIGAPIPGVCALVLDARLHPAPIGVVGELYLTGPALAHGYAAQPQLTAQRFVANPFGGPLGAPGTRLYRTGDLARWTPQGTLECLGRADTQIKLRGQRIELGDIENALLACPQVTQAAATIHHTTTGTAHLIGYISGSASLDPTAIRQQLSTRLPAYLIPTQVLPLDKIPLTSSGKLNRNALPPPVFTAAQYRPPQTPTENTVADVFADVLGLDRAGLDDDFFALGGDSLLATRLSTRLQLALNTEVPVRSIFDAPTVADLADHLHRQRTGRIRPPVAPVRRPDRIPLSYAQQRLWFLNQFEGGAATYNMPTAFRIKGALDVEALGAALDDVIARHESLRTVFPDIDGVPFQEVLPARAGMWRRGGAAVMSLPEQDVAGELVALAGYRFDLSAEIPIRAQIYSVGPEQHVVGIVVHHIACDGWSLAPMVRDMGQAYRARRQGRAPQWAPLTVQYVDYTLWQRDWLGAATDPDSVIAGQLAYWRQELADLPEVVSLPADRARPPVPSYRGDAVQLRIDPQVWAGAKELAATHDATVSMVLQAVLAVLLHRVGAGEDIVMGAPIAGRLDEALDELVGFFVNTWVSRVSVNSRHRFSDVLQQVRQKALNAYSNQDVPFELLVERLNPVRSGAHHPLFQVAMAFQNNVRPEVVAIDGVSVEQLAVVSRTAKFDLHFDLGEVPTADPAAPMAAGTVSYATDLFDRTTIERLVTRFVRLLEAVVADGSVVVGEVSLLDGGERELVVAGFSGAGVAAPVGVVSQVLAAAVAADPDAVAIIDGARQVSYRQLDESSTRLARVLIEAGVGPERAVGVAMDRCAELVVTWWAVVKAGGVYVPVEAARHRPHRRGARHG